MAFGLITALAGFALDGASAIASNNAQKALARKNRASATAAYRLNTADLRARSRQADEAAALDVNNLTLQGDAAVSSARASAAEAGVAGSSVTALLDSYLGQTASAQAVVQRNAQIQQEEIARRGQAATMEFKDRMSGVSDGSSLLTGLKIGESALNTVPALLPYLAKGTR